uniref:Histone-lysine N-methyltransferase ASHH3 n=1 Tax=Cajanus cajan TaxID=3821 RepID=A0A151U431_CAJCA|nr:Histone-lysine N-methyltransferase ASHH3 [Cajanus cajan]
MFRFPSVADIDPGSEGSQPQTPVVYHNGGLQIGSSRVVDQSKCLHNCIGEVIRIKQLGNVRFGIIKRFDKHSRKHSVMFEDGCVEIFDMSKEDWELVR